MRYYTPDEIHYADAGVVTLGCDTLRYLLAQTLIRIPADVVDDVFEHCRFHMFELEGCGFAAGSYLPNDSLKGADLILFSRELPNDDKKDQTHLILHEIAHCVLRHRSPLDFGTTDAGETDRLYKKQEKEADALVDEWLEKWKTECEGKEISADVSEDVLFSTKKMGSTG